MKGRPGSHRERGASLLLAFLCLLVLVVVVGELSVSSTVELQIARQEAVSVRLEYAARGGLEIAKSLLLRDLRHERRPPTKAPVRALDVPIAADASAGVSSDDLPPPPPTNAWTDPASYVDSLHDVWARPTTVRFAQDVEVRIRITDEDRKLPLLGLVSKNPHYRELWRSRIVRVLDLLREKTDRDLTEPDAETLADALEAWIRGDRRRDLPTPLQSTMRHHVTLKVWSDSAFSGAVGTDVVFPFSIDDLTQVHEISEDLLNGYYDRGRYVLGLRDVLTAHSTLVFDPHDLDAPEPYVWPFMKKQKGYLERAQNREQLRRERVECDSRHTNHGRVNINTAPVAVIHALLPATAGSSQLAAAVFDATKPSDQPELHRHSATSPSDAMNRVEADVTGPGTFADAERREWSRVAAVRSHVFTLRIEVRIAGSTSEHRPPDPRAYESTVWRRFDAAHADRIVTIVPLHLVTYPFPPGE